ncbi:hypothetical protein [Pseudomonas sp. TE3610]
MLDLEQTDVHVERWPLGPLQRRVIDVLLFVRMASDIKVPTPWADPSQDCRKAQYPHKNKWYARPVPAAARLRHEKPPRAMGRGRLGAADGDQCMNSAIRIMTGIGTPRKNSSNERMVILLN